jgi:hypothetical protein
MDQVRIMEVGMNIKDIVGFLIALALLCVVILVLM